MKLIEKLKISGQKTVVEEAEAIFKRRAVEQATRKVLPASSFIANPPYKGAK